MKKKVTLSMSEEAIARLKEMAEKDHRSASSMVEVLILREKEGKEWQLTFCSYAKAGFKCTLPAFSTKLTKDAQAFGYHFTPAFA